MGISRLPNWFYESSPYLYMFTGLGVLLVLSGPVANGSALLLVLAGALALYLRWKHRHSNRGLQSDGEAALVSLVWDRTTDCEHEVINAEHQELFVAAHELMKSAVDSQPEIVNRLMKDLIRKIESHFRHEEAILFQADTPVAIAHQEEHRALLGKLHALHRGYIAGKIRRHELIDFMVIDVLAQHIQGDKKTIERAFWG